METESEEKAIPESRLNYDCKGTVYKSTWRQNGTDAIAAVFLPDLLFFLSYAGLSPLSIIFHRQLI